MSRRLFAGLVAVLAALALLWWSERDGRGGTSQARVEPAGHDVEAAPAELAPLPLATEEGRAPVESTPPAPAIAELEPAAQLSAETDATGLELSGTMVVFDELGQEHTAELGSFTLFVYDGDTGRGQEVLVLAGRWSTIVHDDPPPSVLSIGNIRLRDRVAFKLEPNERFPVPETRTLRIVARWPPSSVLLVRDRASGRDLAPVLVAEVDAWPQSEFRHPGQDAEQARDLGPSPVTLPASEWDSGERILHVRSPGHAWARVVIDESRGGERLVLLDPSGTLEVVVRGEVSDPGAKLRLYAASHAPVAELDLPGQEVLVIDALAPGTYRVVGQIGQYWSQPLELGTTSAEVTAGQRARVVLVLAATPQRIVVPLKGTLLVPEEWQLDHFQIELELLDVPLGGWEGRTSVDRSSMTPDGPGRYRWSAGKVQPGRYEVELEELGFIDVLEVGSQGLTDAWIEVAPPCNVRVRCVEEDSGLEVTTESVNWHGAIPDGVRGWSNARAEWDELLRCWRFRAPIGRIRVSTHGQDYGHTFEDIEVRAGSNDVVLRLSRLCGLTLVLQDGSTEIPWDQQMTAKLEPAEGQPAYDSRRWGNGSFTLLRRDPGAYELTLDPIPGYEPVPPTRVHLEKGVITRHEVRLVRAR